MLMADELKGLVVLVHPDLVNDPVNRQNQVGVISHADLMNDDIFVRFDGEQGLYASVADAAARRRNSPAFSGYGLRNAVPGAEGVDADRPFPALRRRKQGKDGDGDRTA